MTDETTFRTLAVGAREARDASTNHLEAESNGLRALALDTAARNLKLARRRAANAELLRRLAFTHRQRGNHGVALDFETQATALDMAVEHLENQSQMHAEEAAAHSMDVKDSHGISDRMMDADQRDDKSPMKRR